MTKKINLMVYTIVTVIVFIPWTGLSKPQCYYMFRLQEKQHLSVDFINTTSSKTTFTSQRKIASPRRNFSALHNILTTMTHQQVIVSENNISDSSQRSASRRNINASGNIPITSQKIKTITENNPPSPENKNVSQRNNTNSQKGVTTSFKSVSVSRNTSLSTKSRRERERNITTSLGSSINWSQIDITTSERLPSLQDDFHQDCVIEIKTLNKRRISLSLTYTPSTLRPNCSLDYVLIGNDALGIGRRMMTSYNFCDETVNREVISRGNYLWMVYRFSVKPQSLHINLSAETEVQCQPDEMRCSPLQCVTKSKICDGNRDCRNGFDEYCYGRAMPLSSQAEVFSKPPEGERCFLCGDGTCIEPKVARYSSDWGILLWYLCDGVEHCPDGWDERRDICFRIHGRLSLVMECVPFAFPPNYTAHLWKTARCDGTVDCQGAVDEQGCDLPSTLITSRLHWDPLTLSLVIFLAAIVVLSVVIASRRDRANKSLTIHVSGTETTESSEMQSCIVTNGTEIVMNERSRSEISSQHDSATVGLLRLTSV